VIVEKAYSLEVRRLARNEVRRDLIVGDIHGCFGKLEKALDAVGFDPAEGDRLISVGDLVDRGPDCERVLEWLAFPWFFSIRGNHEDMLCMYEDGECDGELYRMNGGGWFMSLPPERRKTIADALKKLPLAIEVETERGLVAVVHADCPTPTWEQFLQTLEHPEMGPRAAMACTWSRNRAQGLDLGAVSDVLAVVVGHTPMERHTTLDNVHFIDTGAWLQGGQAKRDFTILDAATLMRAHKPLVTGNPAHPLMRGN
jgi:serine/threonine protein phosphatase 1